MAENKDKLAKLLTALWALDADYFDKRALLKAEIDELMAGGAGIGAKLKAVYAHWDAAWCAQHPAAKKFDFKAEKGGAGAIGAKVKGWIAAGYSVEDVTQRIDRYMVLPDKYAIEQGRPFWLFARLFNTLTPLVPVVDPRVAAGADKLRGMRG